MHPKLSIIVYLVGKRMQIHQIKINYAVESSRGLLTVRDSPLSFGVRSRIIVAAFIALLQQ